VIIFWKLLRRFAVSKLKTKFSDNIILFGQKCLHNFRRIPSSKIIIQQIKHFNTTQGYCISSNRSEQH